MNGFMPPADAPPRGYWFAGFRLEADGTLVRGETKVRLSAEELAALRLLLARAGEIVSRTELQYAAWGDAPGSASAVTKCITSLRARLAPANCIQTVEKRGYRIAVTVQADGPLPASTLPSLAVLPFAAGFAVPEYRCTAVTEAVMERLGDPECGVATIMARDSAFTLARRGLAAREVGELLHADLVLSGTLKESHGRDRLRAELIRVSDGAQLWIEEMIAEHGRIEELASELVRCVSSRLSGGGLSLSAAADPAEDDEADPIRREARELFLRAHHEWQSLERHRMQDAMGQLLRAIELDPKLIAAQMDLAQLCVVQAFLGFMPARAAASVVRIAAGRAREAPDTLQPSRAWISFHVDHDLKTALKALARSAHLPHDAWTTRMRSMIALGRHRFAEALEMLRAAIALDSYSPWLQPRLAWALHLAGEAEASIVQIQNGMEMFPGNDVCELCGAIILAFNGEPVQAAKLAQAVAARSPGFDIAASIHAYALACAGRRDEARAILERLQWLSRERFVLNTFSAAAYVALGEPEAALAELRISLENRCPWFFQMLADPRLKPLESRPEFTEMRAKLTAMEAKVESVAE